MTTQPRRVLFVCVENSNRSQMAEAFARLHGEGRIQAYSAGSRASGKVNPKAIEAMLWFNEYLGFQPDLRLSEWLGFAIFMPIVFGISFQTPLVMYFLEKIGLFTVESYKDKRRIAWFILAIFAAVITPSTDAFSMLFLWIPMCLLYELGIWICLLSPRAHEEEWENSEAEEMVGV